MIAKLLEDLDIYACGQHQHNNFFYYLPFQGEYREYREYMTLQKDKVTVSGDGPCDLHSHFGHRWKNLTHRARVSTEGGCRQRGSDDALHKFYMYIYCLKLKGYRQYSPTNAPPLISSRVGQGANWRLQIARNSSSPPGCTQRSLLVAICVIRKTKGGFATLASRLFMLWTSILPVEHDFTSYLYVE